VVGWCVIILTFSGLAIAFPAFRYLVILLAAIAARSLLFIPSMLFVGLAFFAPDPNVMREVVSGMGEAMIPQDFMNRVLGNLTACL
jgi:cytochrome b subunit of formate dehydrogenase